MRYILLLCLVVLLFSCIKRKKLLVGNWECIECTTGAYPPCICGAKTIEFKKDKTYSKEYADSTTKPSPGAIHGTWKFRSGKKLVLTLAVGIDQRYRIEKLTDDELVLFELDGYDGRATRTYIPAD